VASREELEIIEKVLSVAEAGEDCLQHLQLKIGEGKFLDSLQVFTDFLQGISSAENALLVLEGEKIQETLQALETLKGGLKKMAVAYENPGDSDPEYIVDRYICPPYYAWWEKLKEARAEIEADQDKTD